jgi:CheY-like chemotaxis protein
MNRVVLVVDDDAAFRELVSDLLVVDVGVDVAVATDGADALTQMRGLRPALVLLDLRMPNIDGFEFCRRVQADPALAGTPVVVITAWGDAEEMRSKASEAGCAGFLAKPFGLEELLSVVSRWLPTDGPLKPP